MIAMEKGQEREANREVLYSHEPECLSGEEDGEEEREGRDRKGCCVAL